MSKYIFLKKKYQKELFTKRSKIQIPSSNNYYDQQEVIFYPNNMAQHLLRTETTEFSLELLLYNNQNIDKSHKTLSIILSYSHQFWDPARVISSPPCNLLCQSIFKWLQGVEYTISGQQLCILGILGPIVRKNMLYKKSYQQIITF